jgi:NAD(P)H dehydrogenase (quinone)
MEENIMAAKVYVVFHSFYGHIYELAKAEVEGVKLFRVAETVPEDILVKSGAKAAQAAFADVPVIQPDQLAEADGIIFGTPTRYGNATSQMRSFIDQTGPLFAKGLLVNKIGGVFTSSNTQHGGQETTIITMAITLLHHGMIVVGIPYSEAGLFEAKEVSGGSPYGASTIAGADGSRQPSANELNLARAQGKRVAELAKKFKG